MEMAIPNGPEPVGIVGVPKAVNMPLLGIGLVFSVRA